MAVRMRALAAALVAEPAAGTIRQARAGRRFFEVGGDDAEVVRRASVERSGIGERLSTGRAAAEAVNNGQPLPRGAVATLVDRRDKKPSRRVVTVSRPGWGAECPPGKPSGGWGFLAPDAGASADHNERFVRGFRCHKGRARRNVLVAIDRMKGAKRLAHVS
jgi:hypothetical protein